MNGDERARGTRCARITPSHLRIPSKDPLVPCHLVSAMPSRTMPSRPDPTHPVRLAHIILDPRPRRLAQIQPVPTGPRRSPIAPHAHEGRSVEKSGEDVLQTAVRVTDARGVKEKKTPCWLGGRGGRWAVGGGRQRGRGTPTRRSLKYDCDRAPASPTRALLCSHLGLTTLGQSRSSILLLHPRTSNASSNPKNVRIHSENENKTPSREPFGRVCTYVCMCVCMDLCMVRVRACIGLRRGAGRRKRKGGRERTGGGSVNMKRGGREAHISCSWYTPHRSWCKKKGMGKGRKA
ncbi:hypothetical protein OF83DRAFT_195735 [Amylostereum chailletii]|nr:hypothetical protein OF83DRAFT_195735 [Amylostereum chailletii]